MLLLDSGVMLLLGLGVVLLLTSGVVLILDSWLVLLLGLGVVFSPLYCSSSLSCINEYLVIDSGGHVYQSAFTH